MTTWIRFQQAGKDGSTVRVAIDGVGELVNTYDDGAAGAVQELAAA